MKIPYGAGTTPKEGIIVQHCMNCGIGMHGALYGTRWGDIICDSNIIISRLSQRGLGNTISENVVICKKCMKACRLLNGRKKRANRLGNGDIYS